MVFSSIPVYPNWNQQSQQLSVVDGGKNPQLSPLPAPSGGHSGGLGSVKPSSMLELAKLAKIPVLETALKCPRCDSTNTKFCYFNNYNLTQPRHFCKTCRRYWTRGGALRNVPVCGGCRRNKRTKGSKRSKSPSKASSSSSTGLITNISSTNDILGHNMPPPLQIFPPLNQLNDFNLAGIGLNYGGIQNVTAATGGDVMKFQIGSSNSVGNFISSGLVDQLRFQQMQQFPSLTNLEPQNGLYSYEGEGAGTPSYVSQLRSKPLDSVVTQFATVKMEENYQQQQGLNLSKKLLGFSGNDQYWTGNPTFSDLPGFTSSSSSSSTSHLL